jgi:hypothetical protein
LPVILPFAKPLLPPVSDSPTSPVFCYKASFDSPTLLASAAGPHLILTSPVFLAYSLAPPAFRCWASLDFSALPVSCYGALLHFFTLPVFATFAWSSQIAPISITEPHLILPSPVFLAYSLAPPAFRCWAPLDPLILPSPCWILLCHLFSATGPRLFSVASLGLILSNCPA